MKKIFGIILLLAVILALIVSYRMNTIDTGDTSVKNYTIIKGRSGRDSRLTFDTIDFCGEKMFLSKSKASLLNSIGDTVYKFKTGEGRLIVTDFDNDGCSDFVSESKAYSHTSSVAFYNKKTRTFELLKDSIHSSQTKLIGTKYYITVEPYNLNDTFKGFKSSLIEIKNRKIINRAIVYVTSNKDSSLVSYFSIQNRQENFEPGIQRSLPYKYTNWKTRDWDFARKFWYWKLQIPPPNQNKSNERTLLFVYGLSFL